MLVFPLTIHIFVSDNLFSQEKDTIKLYCVSPNVFSNLVLFRVVYLKQKMSVENSLLNIQIRKKQVLNKIKNERKHIFHLIHNGHFEQCKNKISHREFNFRFDQVYNEPKRIGMSVRYIFVNDVYLYYNISLILRVPSIQILHSMNLITVLNYLQYTCTL